MSNSLTLLVHPPDCDESGAGGQHEESGEEDAADQLAVHDALLARVEDAPVLGANSIGWNID